MNTKLLELSSHQILHAAYSQQHFVPKTNLNIDKRAFSVAAPTIWNKLTITIKSSETGDTFRKKT